MDQLSVIKKMSEAVSGVFSDQTLIGFERAYRIAGAVEQLRELLTPEYMQPIMKLQGSRLGFKTDMDKLKGGAKGPGYSMEIVRDCLIEAVLLGVQPYGNQFNIIQGGCYLTKEGFGYLLKNMPGLTWKITPSLPRINSTSAAVEMKIEYTHNGIKGSGVVDIPIKVNEYMGADAVLGKAERKARAWLHRTVTGSEAPEGDIMDIDYQTMKSTIKGEPEITHEQLSGMFTEKGHLLSDEEKTNAFRILSNKEAASYRKLHKILTDK